MILGVGTDLIDQRRIAAALDRHGPRFAQRMLAEAEMPDAGPGAVTASALAKAWAAKEAVAKALGTGFRGMAMRDIAVLREASGQPVVQLSDGAAERLRNLGGGAVHLSLSDEPPHVLAFAVIEARTRP